MKIAIAATSILLLFGLGWAAWEEFGTEASDRGTFDARAEGAPQVSVEEADGEHPTEERPLVVETSADSPHAALSPRVVVEESTDPTAFQAAAWSEFDRLFADATDEDRNAAKDILGELLEGER